MAHCRLLLLPVGFIALFLALTPGPQPASPRARADTPDSAFLITRLGNSNLRQYGGGPPTFRPDGTAIATGNNGSAAVVEWDVATGNARRRFIDPGGPARYSSIIGYTPDGNRLVATFDLRRTVVFDTATGGVVCQVAHAGTFAADRRRMAGRDRNGVLTVWSLETGDAVATFSDPPVYHVEFSPDGRWLAAGFYLEHPLEGVPVEAPEYKGIAWVWPAAGGERRTLALPGDIHTNGVTLAWAAPDRLVAFIGRHMALFDVTTGERLATAVPSGPDTTFSKVWIKNGQMIVSEWTATENVEFDPATLKPLPGGRRQRDDPFGEIVSPDGSARVEYAGNQYVHLVDARTNRPLHPHLDRFPNGCAGAIRFTADGRRMITGSGDSLVWDLASGLPRCRLGRLKMWTDAFPTPDGRYAVGLDQSSNTGWPLVVWDANTGVEVFREGPLRSPWTRRTLGLDSDGAFWVHESEELVRYEVPSGRLLRTVRLFENSWRVCLAPDGSRIVAGSPVGLAVLRTDSDRWQKLDDPEYNTPVALDRRGSRLLVGCGHPSETGWQLRAWSLADRPAVTWSGSVGAYPVFTPDGRFVLAGVVEPEKDAPQGPIPGTNLTILTAPTPRVLRVSDADTGAELFRFDPGGEPTGYAVTPDNTRLIVAHTDTALTVWDWTAILRARLSR